LFGEKELQNFISALKIDLLELIETRGDKKNDHPHAFNGMSVGYKNLINLKTKKTKKVGKKERASN
jgi:hypothetical protein